MSGYDRLRAFKNYILAYLVIATTGIHFFSQRYVKLGLLVILTYFFILRIKKIKRFKNSVIFWGIVFSVLIIIQQYKYAIVDPIMYLNTLAPRVILPWLLYHFLDDKLPKYYVKVMVILAIISFLFWLPDNLVPGFHSQISKLPYILNSDPNLNRQFLLYTVEDPDFRVDFIKFRNPGQFIEPGVFGLFLTVALIFQIIFDEGKITWKSLLFIVTMLTTFSTATYLGLVVIFIYLLLRNKKIHFVFRVSMVLISFIIFFQFFMNTEFLYEKLRYQYSLAIQKSLYQPTQGRFYGTRKALNAIKEAPIFGRGLSKLSEVTDFSSPIYVRYTFLSTTVELGLIVFFYLLYHLLRYFRLILVEFNFDVRFSYFTWMALLLNLYSQNFMISTLFLCFVFYSFDKRFVNGPQKESVENVVVSAQYS